MAWLLTFRPEFFLNLFYELPPGIFAKSKKKRKRKRQIFIFFYSLPWPNWGWNWGEMKMKKIYEQNKISTTFPAKFSKSVVFQSLKFHSLNHTLTEIDLKEQYFDIIFGIFFLLENSPFKKEKSRILFFIFFTRPSPLRGQKLVKQI